MSYNRTILLGNLTRDPELKYTPKGSAVCKFGLALNRKWKNDAGEMREEVTFVDLTAWGKTAETIGQYFRKGSMIHVEGRLKLDQWDDKETGQKQAASLPWWSSRSRSRGRLKAMRKGQHGQRKPRKPTRGHRRQRCHPRKMTCHSDPLHPGNHHKRHHEGDKICSRSRSTRAKLLGSGRGIHTLDAVTPASMNTQQALDALNKLDAWRLNEDNDIGQAIKVVTNALTWQPISTAPRDGTEILLGGWEYFAGWIWNQSVASWDAQYGIWQDWAGNGLHFNQTHWHPINNPPQIP